MTPEQKTIHEEATRYWANQGQHVTPDLHNADPRAEYDAAIRASENATTDNERAYAESNARYWAERLERER